MFPTPVTLIVEVVLVGQPLSGMEMFAGQPLEQNVCPYPGETIPAVIRSRKRINTTRIFSNLRDKSNEKIV
jgi:hypothetical protein